MKTRNKPKKAEKKEEFFVAINSPSSNKVAILEARRDILESMRLFKALKEIRKKKIDEKVQLKKKIRQISSLLSRLKSVLPHTNIHLDIQEKSIEKEFAREEAPKATPKFGSETELDRIESQLAEIEGKLSEL